MTKDNQKGFALVLSLVLLLAMSLMGGALIVIASSDHQSNNSSDEYQQAFYVAETGLLEAEKDLINYFNNLVPMDNKLYIHTTEGKDDMPAHIKSSITNNQISLSIKDGKLLLGTWQGIYLFEHRINPQSRIIIHHFLGET